eukprot:COSAG02_NODE_1123_length_14441_cov_28.984521_7_plen_231_part_00
MTGSLAAYCERSISIVAGGVCHCTRKASKLEGESSTFYEISFWVCRTLGSCAPPAPGINSSCAGLHSPWPDRYDDCCTAGACAERTVPNMVSELSDISTRLQPTQSLHLLVYSSGSGCGIPSIKYTADALSALLPRIDRKQPAGSFLLDGVINYVLTGLNNSCDNLKANNATCTRALTKCLPNDIADRGCILRHHFGGSLKSDDDITVGAASLQRCSPSSSVFRDLIGCG